MDCLPSDPTRPSFDTFLTQGCRDDVNPNSKSAASSLAIKAIKCESNILACALGAFLDEIYDNSLKDLADVKASYATVNDLSAPPTVTFDSASDIHLFTSETATKLFKNKRRTDLRIVGVSNVPGPADFEGGLNLQVYDDTGNSYTLQLGTAYASRDVPLNLLSVALVIREGGIFHLEKGNCYFQPHPSFKRIPLVQRNGMFELPVEAASSFVSDVPSKASSFAVHGHCFGAAADWTTWHQRMRHVPLSKLKHMHHHSLVDGFAVRGGNKGLHCGCDACRQAKIRRARTPRDREYGEAKAVGEIVSTDTKSVPFTSLHGYRYVVCYVDVYSKFGMCYFMRGKNETASTLKRYLADMKHLGVDIKLIQSDRGSEYFEQEGGTLVDRDRRLHEFRVICKENVPEVYHRYTPVEVKEKVAEAWNRDHFEAADAFLWQARLSPVFWPDAVAYSQYLFNRCPNERLGGITSPWTVITGERPNWHKIKVFGCDCFEHIPNNPFAKVPGVPKGRKLIFTGFDSLAKGWRVFDPETRRYFSSSNLYFYESFRHRIDALRHHDSRRALLKSGAEQPFVIDDFEPDTFSKSISIRQLYLDPGQERDDTPASEGAAAAPTPPPVPNDGSTGNPSISGGEKEVEGKVHPGPLSQEACRAAKARAIIRSSQILRPLRVSAVGVPIRATAEDMEFLNHAIEVNAPLVFMKPCPKSIRSMSGQRYMKYMHATTTREALQLGCSKSDLKWDHERGWIQWPKHESDLPGHIFNCSEVAEQHRLTHVLDDYGTHVQKADETEFYLKKVLATFVAKDSRQVSFNEAVASSFELDNMLKLFEERDRAIRFSEYQSAKVLNSNIDEESRKIDFSIAPEPIRFAQVQPEVCAEADQWKSAMDEEMYSMTKYEVYQYVPKSLAKGRQILGSRWVYKRKVGKDGKVYRYRARIVAQGYRQTPYDSFDPDETYSPVVHKDTLRLFLSVCAAKNLQVFSCDISAAFLQAPLTEEIYLKCPDGYSKSTSDGEEMILKLSKAIYGLKQSSAVFYKALSNHLIEKGYESILGDPCLFKKTLPDGRVALVCCYVDDLVVGVPDAEMMETFLAELRERFDVKEGEGQPVDWLLGMAVSQDIDRGTIRISMEMMIRKLAEGLLTEEELARSKSVRTPMLKTPLLKETECTVSKDEFDYLSVVGSLLHIANCVRCDISYAVGVLSRHAATPGPAHVKAAKRVVMYLFNTLTLGITYRRPDTGVRTEPVLYEGAKHPLDDGTNRLMTFADSDYAGSETRRSTMGTVLMLNGGPIAWCSTLGKTVALSTCEAEVNAACLASKDALHFSQMLFDIGAIDEMKALQIAEDNAACIAQVRGGLRHVRKAKHYEVKLAFLQQLVVDNKVQFVYCPTDVQYADLFTKGLEVDKFEFFRDAIFGMQ
jgi:hypothetical protein